MYVNCGLINVDESDICRNEHYPSSLKIRPEKNSGLCGWLVSSVGRALHRCRRGHGFKLSRGLKNSPLKEEDLNGVVTFYG